MKLRKGDMSERQEGLWVKPTGMIIPEYRDRYQCSECDAIMMRDWRSHRPIKSKYCPNCGASMLNADDEGGTNER